MPSPEPPQPRRARTFVPDEWWLLLVRDRVRVRAMERDPIVSGRFTQLAVLDAIRRRFGAEYSQAELSRCIAGYSSSIVLLEQLSEVLEIPAPVYAMRTEEEARRVALQRQVTVQLEEMQAKALRQAEANLDAEMASMEKNSGSARGRNPGQSQVVKRAGEEDGRGGPDRGVDKRRRSPSS